MHPMLNTAVRAAREAGKIIARSADRIDSLDIAEKTRNDFVSEVDKAAENTIVDILLKTYPEHSILAEEGGEIEGNDYQWIIDPLDGTTNFLHGFPHYAVSIALLHKGIISQAVIYNPHSQELFTASRGAGAQVNGRRVRVSKSKGLQGALLGTGFPFRNQELLETYLATFSALFTDTAGIRRPGSAALDLAYVAAGRLDGFWEFSLKPWDIAAGALIVQEAGGLVGDFAGGHNYLKSGNVVAGNPKMFKAILQTIRPHLPDSIEY